MMPPERFLFYWDGMDLSNVPPDALNALERSGIISKFIPGHPLTSRDQKSLSFCGVLQLESSVYTFLPKGYPHPKENAERATAKKLMKCISKYCNNTGYSANEDTDPLMIGDLNLFPLYKEILEDYIRNGLFNAHDQIKTRRQSGKIDWKSTINEVSPVITGKHSAFYPEFITRQFRYNSSNEITKIHASIVKELDERHGWWFSKNESDRIAPELTGAPYTDANFKNGYSIIKNELDSTFYERNIRLLKNILKFIEAKPYRSANSLNSFGVAKFEVVWERMIDQVLKPSGDNIRNALPTPAYETALGQLVLLKAKSGRIDTLLKCGNVVAVVDAKYYNVKNVHSAPGWPDLVKQFFYEKLVKSLDSEFEISNVFVLPESSSAEKPIFGCMATEDNNVIKTLDHIFPRVSCVYTCPSLLIDNYLDNKRDLNLKEIIFALSR